MLIVTLFSCTEQVTCFNGIAESGEPGGVVRLLHTGPTVGVGGRDLSGLSERVGVSCQCGVNSSMGTALCLSEAFWLIQYVKSVATHR